MAIESMWPRCPVTKQDISQANSAQGKLMMSFVPQVFQAENNTLIDSLLQRQESLIEDLDQLEQSVSDYITTLANQREAELSVMANDEDGAHGLEASDSEEPSGSNPESEYSRAA